MLQADFDMTFGYPTDLTDKPKIVKELYPYCTWLDCTGGTKDMTLKSKRPSKNHFRRCPDCGHALTWRDLTNQDLIKQRKGKL